MKNLRRNVLLLSSALLTIIMALATIFLFLQTLQVYQDGTRQGNGLFAAVLMSLTFLPGLIAAAAVFVHSMGASTSGLVSGENGPKFIKLLDTLYRLFLTQAATVVIFPLVVSFPTNMSSMAFILVEVIGVVTFFTLAQVFSLVRDWLTSQNRPVRLDADSRDADS